MSFFDGEDSYDPWSERFEPLSLNPTPQSLEGLVFSPSQLSSSIVAKFKGSYFKKKDPCEAATYEAYVADRKQNKNIRQKDLLTRERWEKLCTPQEVFASQLMKAPAGRKPVYMMSDDYNEYVKRMKSNNKKPLSKDDWNRSRKEYEEKSGKKRPVSYEPVGEPDENYDDDQPEIPTFEPVKRIQREKDPEEIQEEQRLKLYLNETYEQYKARVESQGKEPKSKDEWKEYKKAYKKSL